MKKFLCMLLICLLTTPALAESLPDQGLGFIQAAGIEADSVVLMDNELVVNLVNGGTASLYVYGDFDMFDLSWRFNGATDGDVALYLDHALGLLAALEDKLPPEGTELSASDAMRANNYRVMVSNSLGYLERVGEQGLSILLAQLSRHDDSGLNSLRARLASRLLGFLDATPVDPAEGLAWYDALVISVQDALPPVDASIYEADPLLAAADQLMMIYEEERRSNSFWPHVDGARSRNIVAISAAKVIETEEHATIWGLMASSQYALYDGCRLKLVSGWWPHLRIEMQKVDGEWTLEKVIFAEDGTENAPSILRFCDNDKTLQTAVMTLKGPDMDAAVLAYLAANGYTIEAAE